MTDHDAMNQRIANATRALAAYERGAFPDAPSLLPGDSHYAEAVLGALLCDLQHYADARGLDFAEVSANGRAVHDDELAEQARYQVGDQVRLRRPNGRSGTITGLQSEPGQERSYFVEVPGVPYLMVEPAASLEPAPPFPRVRTALGEVTRADEAEKALIKLAARNHDGLAPAAQTAHRADCARLLNALSDWSGTPQQELLQHLGPGIAHRITGSGSRALERAAHPQDADHPEQGPTASAAHQGNPAQLAALGFPHNIADGVSPITAALAPNAEHAPPTHTRPGPNPSQSI
ncbi:hypothetical protein SMC26_24060 [Actinomadura fulvescens]|uniref:Uncharacterized protein n=1 Tax=Actinomadura fulvescens TaxID=46160 RepID=A0ABN3Q3K3_9ACTN